MISSSEVLHDNFSVETKDGSCCLDSYDEDHSDDIPAQDIANLLQGMAKVTTENTPILVLGE